MSREPSWDLYRTFGAVLRHGSLSRAARLLGLTQPTVARQIDALEAALGTELFVRTHRGLSPTAAALRLQPHIEALLQTTAALIRDAAASSEVNGTVRITAPEIVGIELLPPILSALRRSHPALTIELSLSDTVEDLLQRNADIAVRMIEPSQKTLVRKRVRSVEMGLYAHPAYLAERGMPQRPADLAHHDLIGFDTETPVVRSVLVSRPWLSRAGLALRSDSAPAQLAAIRSGFGIGYCQTELAERSPELVRVLADKFALDFDMWIVMHRSLRTDTACAMTFGELAKALGRLSTH